MQHHLLVYVDRMKRASNFGIKAKQVPLESTILPMLLECVTWLVKLKVFMPNAMLIKCQRWAFFMEGAKFCGPIAKPEDKLEEFRHLFPPEKALGRPGGPHREHPRQELKWKNSLW